MSIININDKHTRAAVIIATTLFLCTALIYFLPVSLDHKIAIPLAVLTAASIFICPWTMTLAFLFCSLGDYAGSCNNFIAQMGFFALGHIWFVVYFINRYREKVGPVFGMTAKAKGFLAMVIFCALVLLAVLFFRIAPCAEEAAVRVGLCVYACVICMMMIAAMMQRSSLFALGSVLFVFSDFIIAWDMFVEPVPNERYLIMLTYYLAQWLLFIRSTKFRVAPEMRLMRF